MDSGRLSWTLLSLLAGSHLSVAVSPEDYSMSEFLGDYPSAVRVFDANVVVDSDTLATVTEAVWTCFTRFSS